MNASPAKTFLEEAVEALIMDPLHIFPNIRSVFAGNLGDPMAKDALNTRRFRKNIAKERDAAPTGTERELPPTAQSH